MRCSLAVIGGRDNVVFMGDMLVLAIHLFVTLATLLSPDGVRAVAAELLLLKQQFIVNNRSRQRALNLTSVDRFVLGLITLFVSPRRIPKLSAVVQPATLLKFHNALVDRRYRLLFSSSSRRRKPGAIDPSAELMAAIVEMKRRNPEFGCLSSSSRWSMTCTNFKTGQFLIGSNTQAHQVVDPSVLRKN